MHNAEFRMQKSEGRGENSEFLSAFRILHSEFLIQQIRRACFPERGFVLAPAVGDLALRHP